MDCPWSLSPATSPSSDNPTYHAAVLGISFVVLNVPVDVDLPYPIVHVLPARQPMANDKARLGTE